MSSPIERREFLRLLAASTAALALPGCGEPDRYTAADLRLLEQQRADERGRAGQSRFGLQRYAGYRGLAELPWFELDTEGRLRHVSDAIPAAIDFHCHLGMSLLLAPEVDLQARTPRVRYKLDCDASEPPCSLDLDVYINGNFTPAAERALWWDSVAQGLWGSAASSTQTIPNLLDEMDAVRVEQAVLLPIALGLPFGDDLTERWLAAIAASPASARPRLRPGASVHPRDPERLPKLEQYAAAGARVVKLHPTMQRFYPDAPEMMEIYAACERLGLIVFFHTGRAGIEPEVTQRYALPRHYEGALAAFPRLPFVLGHAGARDARAALELALRHENAWIGIHGQGLTQLDEIVRRSGGSRLLFGSDWPFYPLAATLAKVLIVTEGHPEQDALRAAILRGNAERLLGASPALAATGRAQDARGAEQSGAPA